MEQQAGQINWAPYNPLPARGAVALWTAQAYAHGCDVVSYFRWRAATVAQELMHSGMLRHDETLDRGGEEIAALELQRPAQRPGDGAASSSCTTTRASGSTTCSRTTPTPATGGR